MEVVRKQRRKKSGKRVIGRRVFPSRQHFAKGAGSLDTTLPHARCFPMGGLVLKVVFFRRSRAGRTNVAPVEEPAITPRHVPLEWK
jgi:hypothetical protein